MKRKLQYITLLFFIGTISSCTSDENFISETSKQAPPVSTIDDMINNLQESFCNGVTRSQEVIYPSYYGGLYVNKNNNLIILSTGAFSDSDKKDIEKRCKSNSFEIQDCQYSLNELNEGLNLLKNRISPSIAKDLDIKSYYLVDNENRIYIGLGNCSQNNIDKFKLRIADFPFLSFTKVDNIKSQSTEVKAGAAVYSKYGGSDSSLGYRGICDGETGFVMAAHTCTIMSPVYLNDSNEQIGQIKKFEPSSDVAFCALSSGFDASQYTADYVNLNASTESVYIGKNVRICGKFNASSGSVISTNYSFVSQGGYIIYGAIQATYPSQNGDSGAVIYTDNHNIAGMHDASISQGGTSTALFIAADNVNSALSLTMF